MSNNNTKFKEPIVFSLSEINSVLIEGAQGFNIPIYQRLYSWGKKEIEKLLQDISDTLKTSPNGSYYIGNLTINYNKTTNYLDIIDGQQRMTTLWLLGLIISKRTNGSNWEGFLTKDDKNLIYFTAREGDNQYLSNLLKTNTPEDDHTINNSTINVKMYEAIKVISDYLTSLSEEQKIKDFAEFVFNNVKMAAIYLPEEIDLNKYFEDMNNRGLQLEAHHIIKARILNKIDPSKHEIYGKIWDAISQMNQYIEYGLSMDLKESRKAIYSGDLKSFLKTGLSSNSNKRTLRELIQLTSEENKDGTQYKEPKEPSDRIISIINFNEFLLLSWDLYFENKCDIEIKYNDKKLLDNFNEIDKYNFDPENFIRELLRYRILFDNYIVKSISKDGETTWEIKTVGKTSDDEFIRKESSQEKDGLIQLQSMLAVSTNYAQWLKDVMKHMLPETFEDGKPFQMHLEQNIVSQLFKTNDLLAKDFNILHQGTVTNRSWFFLLDYLLWKKWTSEENEPPKIEGIPNLHPQIRKFQFRESRSVEHIHPQHPLKESWNLQEGELRKIKDRFGNLALISVNSNSAYNRDVFDIKKTEFIKRSKKWGIESLKLVDVYSRDIWDMDSMESHENKMIQLLKETIHA